MQAELAAEDIWGRIEASLDADEAGAAEGATQHFGADAVSQAGSAISSMPLFFVKRERPRAPRKQPQDVANLLARLCNSDPVALQEAFQEACDGIYKQDRPSKKTPQQEAPGTEPKDGPDRNGIRKVAVSAAAKTFGDIWREKLRDAGGAALFAMRRDNPGMPDTDPTLMPRCVASRHPHA